MAEPDDEKHDPAFEEVVAALLKVDPTGITGQRAKRRDDEDDDARKAPPPK